MWHGALFGTAVYARLLQRLSARRGATREGLGRCAAACSIGLTSFVPLSAAAAIIHHEPLREIWRGDGPLV
jgi:hypothetical protein